MRLETGLEPLSAELAPLGVVIGARRIRPGDEGAFSDPALESTPDNLARRRASGAARIVATRLLPQLGVAGPVRIARLANGAPDWPPGILGSIAHGDLAAVAALARRGGALAALGVDIEADAPLPEDVFDFVLTPRERRFCPRGSKLGRLAFAAKEAVYKAIHPFDGSPLEYQDIECAEDFASAQIAGGARLRLRFMTAPAIIVVAALAA